MPLFYQHNINHSTKLAIWHIKESEDFFLKKVPLQNEITHWHKRLQHLAGRYLLQELYPDFPYHLIEIANTRKPFLPNEKYHFSISHCGDYVAVLVSRDMRVGIDIELVTPKIQLIKHKFLSEEEQKLLPDNNLQLLTLLWSCKEAVFKWYGIGGVNFKSHIIIENISLNDDQGIVSCRFMKNKKMTLKVNFRLIQNLCLVWVTG
ncbi:MAG: 4'-phosphopantetheinyl transferase superfamily protein [Ginsengibacter sp.]